MILPSQMITMSDKFKRHNKTGKNNIEETIDYYISSCGWSKFTEEIERLYGAVEGFINQDEYKSQLNPYNNKDTDTPLVFNAQLNNYNILKGIVNLLMGEFGRRSHDYSVLSFGPDDNVAYKDGLNLLLKNYYSQHVANELSKMGLELGQTAQELPPLEQYVQGYKEKYDLGREVSGQEALDYIKYNCDLDDKYLDLYWDWIITGGCCTFKTVNQDDVVFEIVPRHELWFPHEQHSKYIEDYSYHVRRRIMPMYQLVDFFKGRIEEDVLRAIESEIESGLSLNFTDVGMTGRRGSFRLPTSHVNKDNPYQSMTSGTNGIELYHVVYTSYKDYQVLTYDDGTGIRDMDVDASYKLQPELGDISLRTEWESIKMEGYKVLDYYLDCGELQENRADLDTNGRQKSPYNGIIERTKFGSIQSIIKEGLPYQRQINVLKFQLEKLMNKNKDKVLVMPYGLINKKGGMNERTTMYHMDATSILWIDESAPNASFAAQMIKSVDMSLGAYIKDTIELIKYVKQEYWDSIGMNAQRYADVGTSAGKAVTEQAIIRSAIITYELTRQFDKMIEKDYQGLLDISKLAWINGKRGDYIRSDSSHAFLDLNQDDAIRHSEASFNVFIRDSSVDTEAIQALRGQGMNLIQNGADASIIGKLWKYSSVSKLTKVLEKAEENKKEYERLMEETKAKNQQALQDSINANDKENRDLEIYKSDNQLEGVKYTADARNQNQSNDNDVEDNSPSDLDVTTATHKMRTEDEKLALSKKAQASKDKEGQQKIQLAKETLAAKIKADNKKKVTTSK